MASKTTFFKSVVKFVKKNMPTIKKVAKKVGKFIIDNKDKIMKRI